MSAPKRIARNVKLSGQVLVPAVPVLLDVVTTPPLDRGPIPQLATPIVVDIADMSDRDLERIAASWKRQLLAAAHERREARKAAQSGRQS